MEAPNYKIRRGPYKEPASQPAPPERRCLPHSRPRFLFPAAGSFGVVQGLLHSLLDMGSSLDPASFPCKNWTVCSIASASLNCFISLNPEIMLNMYSMVMRCHDSIACGNSITEKLSDTKGERKKSEIWGE